MTAVVAVVVGVLIGRILGRLGSRIPQAAAVRRIALALACALGGAAVLFPTLTVLDAGTLRLRLADVEPSIPLLLLSMHGGQLGAVVCARTMGEDLGVGRPDGGWGPALVLPALAIGVSAAWSLLLTALGAEFGNQAIVDVFAEQTALGKVQLGAAIVLAAPLFEELLFRGWVLPRLMRRFGRVPGFWLTALAFTALHLDSPQVAPPILLLALGLGWLRVRSGSVWPGMLAHALNNGLALLLASIV